MVWVHSGLRVLWIRSVLPTSFHWRLPRDLTYKIQSGSTERANRSRCTKFLKKYSKYQNQCIGSKKQKKFSSGFFSRGAERIFNIWSPIKSYGTCPRLVTFSFWYILGWIGYSWICLCLNLYVFIYNWAHLLSVSNNPMNCSCYYMELDLLLGVMNNEQKRKYRRYGSKGHFSQTLFPLRAAQTQQFS